MIVRSAVKLIDKLSLASVLVPASTKNPKLTSTKPTDIVEVMAVYSNKRADASTYMNKDQMSVLNDENLINRIVEYDESRGLMMREQGQESLYIENIMEENFARKAVNQSIKQTNNNQSNHQSTNQSINQPIHQPTNQSINKSIKQSINQPTNQSTNQSINQNPNQT